jgi:hypothetical protein
VIRLSGHKYSGVPFWLIPPLLLILFAMMTGFNGLYGQDSFEYLRFSRALHTFIMEGKSPGTFFWPVLYPLSGALLSFVLPDILSLQLISIVCYGFTCYFLQKILHHLIPGDQKTLNIYLLLFFCISPFTMRYSLTVMSEPMALFFITGFFYYWLMFSEKGKYNYFLALVFFACAAINTRYPSFIIVLIPLLHALYLFFRKFRLSYFLFSLLIAGLVFYPAFRLNLVEQGSVLGRQDFLHWSFVNYFKRDFITTDGENTYMLPNIFYVLKNLIHPGYIFPGLVFLIFISRKNVETIFMKFIISVILIYALFLAGLPFQNDRVLNLTFPLVLILFSRPFITMTWIISHHSKWSCLESSFFLSRRGSQINRRVPQMIDNVRFNFAKLCEKLCETLRETFIFRFFGQHLKILVVIPVILIQGVLFYKAFSPFYRNYRTNRTIAENMLNHPGKKLYTFNIDMALKGYGVPNATISLWSSRVDYFEPGALVLFNFAATRKQWKGMNPMINWESLKKDHHLKLLENFPEGWNLYEITD